MTEPTGAGGTPIHHGGETNPTGTVTYLRPLGSPLPLGFLGLAGGTFVVSGLQLGWTATTQGHAVALILLAFVLPAQFTAAVVGFLCRDTVAATGMGVLAVTWAAVGAVTLTGAPGATSDALGLLLLVAGLALLVPVAAGGTTKLAATVVMAAAAVRFAVTGVYELTGSAGWEDAAGVIGLILAALALYAALALALEDTAYRAVLPTGRLGAGATAFDGTAHSTTGDLRKEAGVRRRL
jgi:succinate-acetate transporter protein